MKILCFPVLVSVSVFAWGQTPNPQDLFNQAVSAQQQGDNARAASLYRQLVKINPQIPAGWINLGAALLNLGQYGEAVESFQKALALDPSNTQIRFALSLGLYKKGDFAAAARQLEPLAKANSADVRVVSLLADCDLHLEKPREALVLLTPLASTAPPGDFSFVYGSALVANGQLQEGADHLETYAKTANAADAFVLAGDALLRLNISERALADLEAAARIAPGLPGVYTKLGEALERNSRYAEAADAYKKATEQNPKEVAAWVGLGANLYSQRDLSGARAALMRALQLDPASVDARYTMALVEKSDGQLTPAVNDLEAVVKAKPKFMPAHAELAALYFRVHRSQDGLRERQIVDQLANEQRQEGP